MHFVTRAVNAEAHKREHIVTEVGNGLLVWKALAHRTEDTCSH